MPPGSQPLISCLMVTRGGLFPARLAVDCYRRQDWANRELVIVCDRAAAPLRDHVAGLGDPSIRWIDAPAMTLGELRNLAVSHARGPLVAGWDDDDLHHPQRLVRQAARLAEQRAAAAVFLERWRLWWPARTLLAVSGRRSWEGSMLAHRDAVPVYPALPRDEDRAMAEMMAGLYPVVHLDAPDLYLYVIHGANSWDAPHFEAMFGWASDPATPERYEAELARLSRVLPVADYRAGLAAAA